MKPIARQSNKEAGWTVIELMTVMAIIIMLIGLLVPALNQVRRYGKKVAQKNQFHTIEVAMELFNAEWERYPPSEATDEMTRPYCGAMKLAEAMVGWDLLGFHPESHFNRDGTDGVNPIYVPPPADQSARRQYLKPESANANRLGDLYPNVGGFDGTNFVLCDMYTRVMQAGRFFGTPVLYYSADASKTEHNIAVPMDPRNIYNFRDNHDLVGLGVPWAPSGTHLLLDPKTFYEKTLNTKIGIQRPHRADSYILLSAGWDALYGTDDDIFNFGL
jgi:type II secretory pathway pseudopilin PulG